MLLFNHGEVRVYTSTMELKKIITRKELGKRSDMIINRDLSTRHHISVSSKFNGKPLPKE